MTDIVSPYVNTEYHTRVALMPDQMNNDIYTHLKLNLKKDVEDKCNKHGYVVKIFKILDYKDGVMDAENFMASAIFNVKYSCRMCIPVENTKLICTIKQVTSVLTIAENGPVVIMLSSNHLNNKVFKINSNKNITYKKNGKIELLKPNDMVKITVMAKKFYLNHEQIKVIGYLENIATLEEKKMYYNDLHYNELDDEQLDKLVSNADGENDENSDGDEEIAFI